MSDLSRDYHGRWRFSLPAPSSNRLWRSGMEKRPMCQQRNRLCIIGQVATWLLDRVNTMPEYRRNEHESKKTFQESNAPVSFEIRSDISVPALGRFQCRSILLILKRTICRLVNMARPKHGSC